MKKLLLFFLFFVSWAATEAQDKIITIKQDTIACRIVSVNADRISYEQKTEGNQFVGKSIPISEVLHYIRSGEPGSFGERLVYAKPKRERLERRWQFSLQGGLAHSFTDYSVFKNSMISMGNSASDADHYLRGLENGNHFSAGLHYLLTTFLGLGLDYNLFYAATKGTFLSQTYGEMNLPVYTNLKLDERLYIHFAGASFLFQQFPDKKKKIKITQTLSPGIILFRAESRENEFQVYWGDQDSYSGQPPQYYDQANNVTKSTPFGAKGSLSIEYSLTPQLSAGLAGNFMWAKLKKISTKGSTYENTDQELQKSLNISHIDYGLTVRYHF